MQTIPNLSISPEKVAFVVAKIHQYEMEASEPELLADLTDDNTVHGGGGRASTPTVPSWRASSAASMSTSRSILWR